MLFDALEVIGDDLLPVIPAQEICFCAILPFNDFPGFAANLQIVGNNHIPIVQMLDVRFRKKALHSRIIIHPAPGLPVASLHGPMEIVFALLAV